MSYSYIVYWSFYPHLDVHGETTETVRAVLKEFLDDNIKLRHEIVCIIHGQGSGILKNEVHHLLRQNKDVINFHIVPENIGITILRLKIIK